MPERRLLKIMSLTMITPVTWESVGAHTVLVIYTSSTVMTRTVAVAAHSWNEDNTASKQQSLP